MHLQSCSKQHLTMEVATDIAVADIIDPVYGVFVCDSFCSSSSSEFCSLSVSSSASERSCWSLDWLGVCSLD